MQGVHDNYDTDTFKALIAASEELTRTKAEGEQQASHRVIADHLRASGFLVADGVLPANEGRGYVLRRIMRRAMRHAHLLGAKEPLMHRLVPALVAEMGARLSRAGPRPAADRGDAAAGGNPLPPDAGQRPQAARRGDRRRWARAATLPGETAFKLYDTFGFPYDLTEDALRARGLAVDRAGFDAAMAEQKAAARAAWKGSGDKAVATNCGSTSPRRVGATEFTGYSGHEGEGVVLALVKDGARVDSAGEGDTVTVLLNQTPFYGESGGQVGDAGKLTVAQWLRRRG